MSFYVFFSFISLSNLICFITLKLKYLSSAEDAYSCRCNVMLIIVEMSQFNHYLNNKVSSSIKHKSFLRYLITHNMCLPNLSATGRM